MTRATRTLAVIATAILLFAAWYLMPWGVLFDASGFTPRSRCGAWSVELQASYIAANVTISIAYALIPILCGFAFVRTRITRRWVLVPFGLFIWFCGIGHTLENVLVFWWPAYRFFTLWHWCTAMISLATAALLPSVVMYWVLEARQGSLT